MYNFVYKITNNLNGDYYYGVHSTDDLNDGYMGSGIILCNAIKKYGKENFTREIVQYFSHPKYAYCLEAAIVTPELIDDPHCYNLKCGGIGGMKGYKMSDETRNKISMHNAKFWLGKIGPTSGKHHSEVTKQKISNSNMGHIVSEETKQKLSNSHMGHTVSEETKQKISLNHRKNYGPLSEETKQKLSKSHKGKKMHRNTLIALNKATKDTIWVNNGKYNKRIALQDLEYYLKNGFTNGMKPRN